MEVAPVKFPCLMMKGKVGPSFKVGRGIVLEFELAEKARKRTFTTLIRIIPFLSLITCRYAIMLLLLGITFLLLVTNY